MMLACLRQDRPLSVLFDECITRRLLPDNPRILVSHTVDIKHLGWGAKDDVILQYLLNANFDLFVTADIEFYQECLARNIAVAFCEKGKIAFHGETLVLGQWHDFCRRNVRYMNKGPLYRLLIKPVKFYRRYRRRSAALRQKIKTNRQRRKQRALCRCRICGLQCRSVIHLQRHLAGSHTKPKPCPFCGVQCRSEIRLCNHMRHEHANSTLHWYRRLLIFITKVNSLQLHYHNSDGTK